MDWTNEEYVRLYVRETADDQELSWEALALWRAMLTKFDRSGLVLVRHGWRSVAKLVRIPEEVVVRVGPELIADGRVRAVEGGFLAPNFLEAQTASKSDKARQRESRNRRRAAAMSHGVTSGHAASHAVTQHEQGVTNETTADPPASQASETTKTGHDLSHAVTPGHAPSQDVTLCSAYPERSVPPAVTHAPKAEILAGRFDQFDATAPGHKSAMAEWFWCELDRRRTALAREFGLPAPIPLATITPVTFPPSFRELLSRVTEEGANAPKVCVHVLESATIGARSARSLDWLGEKLCTEGGWRWARNQVPTWRAQATANDSRKYGFVNGVRVEL